MTRSAAIAAAYMLAVSQGGAMLRDDVLGPDEDERAASAAY